MDSGVCEVNTFDCVNHVVRVFGLSLEPLEEHVYLLLKVQRGSLFRHKMPGYPEEQKMGAEQGVYQIERGDGGLGDINPVGGCCPFGDPWCVHFFPH